MLVRWPGVIKPGTIKNDIFASLDWVPTLVDIAGGRKGRRVEETHRGRPISRHCEHDARWRRSTSNTSRAIGKVCARYFFYYSGKDPSAVRYKNWKIYFANVVTRTGGLYLADVPYHFTLVVNIKRDPFETSVGIAIQDADGMGGALGSPIDRLPVMTGTCCPSASRSG